MNHKYFPIHFIVVFCIIVAGCNSEKKVVSSKKTTDDISEQPLGFVNFKVVFKDQLLASGKIVAALSIDKVTAFVSASNGEEIAQVDLAISNSVASGRITVPAQNDLEVGLAYYDNELVHYIGKDDDVDVVPGGEATAEIIVQSVKPLIEGSDTTTTANDYVISWESLSGIMGYQLEEDTQLDFLNAQPVYSGTDTTFTISSKTGEGAYYYRVRSSTEYGQSVWSEILPVEIVSAGGDGTIIVETPIPVEPSSGGGTSAGILDEGWEGGLGDWFASRGTWEVGVPTSGPEAAYSGGAVAATVLGGTYANNLDTRLTSPPFVVPSADQNPRLRLWHWYGIWGGDWGEIQIKVEDGDWQTVSESFSETTSGIWTAFALDLSPYAGSSVQLGFRFVSNSNSVSDGWYIDDITILTGPYAFNNPEYWEGGLGDWFASRGTWEVGVPTSGPEAAYSGESVAATVLGGTYANNLDTRLTSPPFVVPSADQNPRLRLWHWYGIWGGDRGEIQIKVEDGDWQTVSESFSETTSGIWTAFALDLSPYAGSSVQLGFRFVSNSNSVSDGWYIDDITIRTD